MKELMYDVNAGLIIALLLVAMSAVIEIGFRFGHRARESSDNDSKSHVNATASSTLGIMALLLAFTFSLSLQRFDTRSDAVVDEANAIGTAYLRAQLLPPQVREDVKTQLRAYVDLRIRADAAGDGRGRVERSGRRGGPNPDRPLGRCPPRRRAGAEPGDVGTLHPGAERHDRQLRSPRRGAQPARAGDRAVAPVRHVPASAD